MGLPAGYIQVEYIQSSGTQYIDTGFKPNQDTRVVMDAQVLSGFNDALYLFAATGGGYYVMLCNPAQTTWYRTRYGTQAIQAFPESLNSYDRITIDKNKNVTTIDSESIMSNIATFQIDYELTLFARNSSGTINGYIPMKLYSCQIYDNGVLVRDFVPCINPSGEIGLYDDVNAEFYTNPGAESFTAGDVILIGEQVGGKINIDAVSKRLKYGYVNIDGVIRRLVKCYANIDGVVRLTYEISLHRWKKYTVASTIAYESYKGELIYIYDTYSENTPIVKGKNYTFNASTGEYILQNTAETTLSEYLSSSLIPYAHNYIQIVSDGTTYQAYGGSNSGNFYPLLARQTGAESIGDFIGNVSSEDANAYPENGIHTDGYWYVKQ